MNIIFQARKKEKESQWAVLRSWEIWVWEFLSEFKVSSSSEIPDSDLRPASSFISVLLILHLPRTRHENKSCSILRSRCLIGWSRHKNTHNSWFGVFLRGFNISEVVLCVCFLLFEKKMRLADCVNCLCLHPAAAFCLHQLTLSLLSDLVWPPGLWLFMCRVIGPIRPAGQPRFKSISVHCEFTGAFTRPFTSTSGSTPLTRTKLKLKNMLVVPVSLLSFLSVTFCVSLPTLCINIRSERCEDPIAQTTSDHLRPPVWGGLTCMWPHTPVWSVRGSLWCKLCVCALSTCQGPQQMFVNTVLTNPTSSYNITRLPLQIT